MKKLLISVLLFIFVTGCGFKVIKISELNSFKITNIITKGEKKINYQIKRDLLNNSNENQNKSVSIVLSTFKNKTIKERNIKNEITKYQLTISAKIEYTIDRILKKNDFEISKTGDFDVFTQHSKTINSEKKLIKLLAESVTEEIISRIRSDINDN